MELQAKVIFMEMLGAILIIISESENRNPHKTTRGKVKSERTDAIDQVSGPVEVSKAGKILSFQVGTVFFACNFFAL